MYEIGSDTNVIMKKQNAMRAVCILEVSVRNVVGIAMD
jgi:hypothetical protein